MVVVRVAQRQLNSNALKKIVNDNREIITNNSEWRVKVVGSQSCMRLGFN